MVTKLANDGRPLATNLCHAPGLKAQCSPETGWLADPLTPLTWGGKTGMHRVGFSQKQVISLKTFTVVFMCAEVVPALCHSAPLPPGPPLHPSTTNLLSVTVRQ